MFELWISLTPDIFKPITGFFKDQLNITLVIVVFAKLYDYLLRFNSFYDHHH